MVSVGGEGRVRHRAVSVFGSPCLPPPHPCPAGWFFRLFSVYPLRQSSYVLFTFIQIGLCSALCPHYTNGIYYGHVLSSHPRGAERDRPDSGSSGLASWRRPLQPCRV